MDYKELFLIAKYNDFNPIILSYADNVHYMIGHMTKKRQYDIATDKQGNPVCFNCISQAKKALKKAGCTYAHFIMQNPYDEMDGENYLGDCAIKLSL